MMTISGSREEPAPPLLRLPPLIRDRIYRFVGLASWDSDPYTFDLRGPGRKCRHPLKSNEPYPDTFHGLLLSCRGIYAEAVALLYSANRFVLYYPNPGPGSLKPLLTLTAPAISSLAALKIVLNQASCHQRIIFDNNLGLDCCHYYRLDSDDSTCGGFRRHQHQPPLLSPTPEDHDDDPVATAQTLLDEWHAAASHLSSHITSKRLELSLVCDIDPQHEKAVDLANSAVEPLRLLPLLKSCHIRLCQTPDSRLRQVAQDAALQSSGIDTSYLRPTSTRTAFSTLPRELRLRILEFTDLVTPNKEVWWSRQGHKYEWSDIGGGAHCLDNMWSSCQFSECWYRTRTYGRTQTGQSIGCFCRRRHSAFSTTCTCWGPPGPALFLICRALCVDAQLVFFSTNRFIVHDFDSNPPWGLQNPDPGSPGNLRYGYPYERLAASIFLREVIPTNCIAHLRFLELVFPPYLPPTWPQPDHPAMQHWRETVGWLRNKINGPILTLRLVGAEIGHDTPDAYYATITVSEGNTIHAAYMDLLQPLKQLAEGPNGLARFYADLLWPWRWTEESENRRLQSIDDGGWGWDWLEGEKRVLKKNAERLVMGDRYDSLYANGKEEPEQSLWQHVFYYHT